MEGVLNIDKPDGWTSHDVVAKLRTLLKIRRIGHTGTLDPAATGVLLCCIGKATRVAEYLVGYEKEYEAVLRLGETTDTQDRTGTTLKRWDVTSITEERLRSVLNQFIGDTLQTPPMYSAIKINGIALHKLARTGHTVPRPARPIHIRNIDVAQIHGTDVTLNVTCSKGTYIRTLCADIGHALGIGAHLGKLARLRIGSFELGNALRLDEVQELLSQNKLSSALHNTDEVLQDFPAVDVIEPIATRVRHGQGIRAEDVAEKLGAGGAGMLVRIRQLRAGLLALGRLSFPLEELGRQGDTRMAISIEKVLV